MSKKPKVDVSKSKFDVSKELRHQIYGSKVSGAHEPSAESSLYTAGVSSRSFTSTGYDVPSHNQSDMKPLSDIEAREPLYCEVRRSKKKGYAVFITNRCQFSVQLNCDICPVTCDNFIQLAESGYYNGTVFHRLVGNFMIQGGDPSGTGRGGRSSFDGGKPFRDEFDSRLSHDSAGTLSMANTGVPDDNKSQFFLLFGKAEHLNNRHTVFGKIISSMSDFLRLAASPTDPATDRPLQDIILERVVVTENPFKSVVDAREEAEGRKRSEVEAMRWRTEDPKATHPKRWSMEVGKYIDWDQLELVAKNKKK
jgi:peptidyl-prolyl cis-trans isomerase-like protein 2